MAAILAGPTLVDCSRTGNGLASCFRERVIESGILPGDDEPSAPLEISSETSSSEPPSITAVVDPPRRGWFDAAANDELPPSLAPVSLTREPGEIVPVVGAPAEAAPIEIALAKEPGHLEDIPPMPPALAPAAVELAAPADPGRIEMAMVAPPSSVIAGELSAPAGRIELSPEPLPGQGSMSTTMLQPDPTPTGSIVGQARLGSGGQGSGWTALTFVPEIVAPEVVAPEVPAVVAPDPAPTPIVEPVPQPEPELLTPPVPMPLVSAPVLAPKPVAPKPAPPVRILKNDPRYPSVTLLPPPNTGAASSFITLTLSP